MTDSLDNIDLIFRRDLTNWSLSDYNLQLRCQVSATFLSVITACYNYQANCCDGKAQLKKGYVNAKSSKGDSLGVLKEAKCSICCLLPRRTKPVSLYM